MSDVDLHETGAYRPGAPRLHRLAQPLLRLFDAHRLGMIEPFCPPPARLLDAGAGRGRFVLAALGAGYTATGIEPSSRGVMAASTASAPVKQASVEDSGVEAESLDCVTVWHVLEHLEDPGAALRDIGGWLKPGGVLVVGVPNLDSLQARLGAGRWFHLDVPRHRVHFTSRGIETLLGRSGFEVVAIHHVLLEHNLYGMWQSLINRVTRTTSYLYNLLKRNAPLRSRDLPVTLLGLAALPAAVVLELLAGWMGRGGTVAVVARRLG